MPVNSRPKHVFTEKRGTEPITRSLTFDEATLIAAYAECGGPQNEPFTAKHLEALIGQACGISQPDRYRRPVLELLQRFVSAGMLVETHPASPALHAESGDRSFRRPWARTLEDFSRLTAASALGIPYVAHVFADIAVRVHVRVGGKERIASGVVVGRNKILTNAHALVNDEVSVSWRNSGQHAARKVLRHPSPEKSDLAIVTVDGFEPVPYPWTRRPWPSEPVVVLAYPSIPQVEERPLLRFAGHVATDEPLTTYFGHEQAIVTAVMGPGASGGPVFARDGSLVGIVVANLEGQYVDEGHGPMTTIFHAMVPGDVVEREIRALDSDLVHFNEWARQDQGDLART